MHQALRDTQTAKNDRVDAVRRSRRTFRISDHTTSQIFPDEGITAMKAATSKGSELRRLRALEEQRASEVRSARLKRYQQATRGAMDESLVRYGIML